MDNIFSEDGEKKVDFLNPPEGSPEGAENFSMKAQREEFLAGGSTNEPPKPTLRLDRLRVLASLAVDRIIKPPQVEGIEHLSEIPQGRRVVFATDHTSDISELAAIKVLSRYRKVDVASLETNQKDLKQKIPEILAGRSRFHDVKNTFDTEKDMPYTSFDSQNYGTMKVAMDKGSDIVISAHRPTRRWEKGALPDHREGIGAVYLAQISDAPIVPVALDIHSSERVGMAYTDVKGAISDNKPKGKPEATVRIGSPMILERIPTEELQDTMLLLTNRNAFYQDQENRQNRDQERYQKAKTTYAKLRQQSQDVMNAVANLLPPEKRGKWGQVSDQTINQ